MFTKGLSSFHFQAFDVNISANQSIIVCEFSSFNIIFLGRFDIIGLQYKIRGAITAPCGTLWFKTFDEAKNRPNFNPLIPVPHKRSYQCNGII